MSEIVLDASALLAHILKEPGGDAVGATLADARASAVNLAEVVQRLSDRGLDDRHISELLDELPCRIDPFTAVDGRSAGLLRRDTRRRGLSLGDRACLTLAMSLNLPVLTADRAWAELDLGVEVVLIR